MKSPKIVSLPDDSILTSIDNISLEYLDGIAANGDIPIINITTVPQDCLETDTPIELSELLLFEKNIVPKEKVAEIESNIIGL